MEQTGRDLVGNGARKIAAAAASHAAAPIARSQSESADALEAEPPAPPPSWVSDTAPSRARPIPEFEQVGPVVVPDVTPFAYEPPFRPRRNPARMWTMIALAGAILLIGLNVGLLMLGGVDGISARLSGQTLVNQPESLLQLAPTGAPERRRLVSGHEILTVTGRIDNLTSVALQVPDIKAELLNSDGKPIYAWTIAAPVPSLGAGASIPFDGVTVDVPAQASRMRLSFVTESAR